MLTASGIVLVVALLADIAMPFIMRIFYKEYNIFKDQLKAFRLPQSPVKKVYKAWMLIFAALICFGTYPIYTVYGPDYGALAVFGSAMIVLYALGCYIIPAFCDLHDETFYKYNSDIVYMLSWGFGNFTLHLGVLLLSILMLQAKGVFLFIICLIFLICALFAIAMYILCDKPFIKDGILKSKGMWQKLNLACLYLPIIIVALASI